MNINKVSSLILTVALTLFVISCSSSSTTRIIDPRVDMQSNPEGVCSLNPQFMWRYQSEVNNVKQLSYRVEVADSQAKLKRGELLWDSGVVETSNTLFVRYDANNLRSGKEYWWRVKSVVDEDGTNINLESEPQSFSTALIDDLLWQAEWIGIDSTTNIGENIGGSKDNPYTRLAARYIRKDFNLRKRVNRAVLYIGTGGSSEPYINGRRVSEDVFANLPTFADSTMFYNTYDITELVERGDNALAIILGNGRFFSTRNPGVRGFGLPRLIAQIIIEYADGMSEVIASDSSWKITASGPIVANSEWDGEEYDESKEMDGWMQYGYDYSSWQNADIMANPTKHLLPQPSPNIRVMERIKPISISEIEDGKYILDMGQNMVGWLKVRLMGKSAQPVTLRFAEILKEDGYIYTTNLRSARCRDIYTPNRDGVFEWEPKFTYHGFRFVEITGVSEMPSVDDFEGCVIYDKMESIGEFTTSDETINQIHKNAYWGIRGNYRGMPTDCPQRDERLGWLGDRTTGAYGESFLFENALLYKKWLKDISDSRNADGVPSDVSPRHWGIYRANVTWPAAYYTCSDMVYSQFGDVQGIIENYPQMKRFVHYVWDNYVENDIVVKDNYGDWCMPPERLDLIHAQDPSYITPASVLGSTIYYQMLNLMIKFAELTSNESDIAQYQEMAARLKRAFNKKFFHQKEGYYANNTVTSNILPLAFDLVPKGDEQRVFNALAERIERDFNSHVSVGVLGIQHLMRTLTKYGRDDLAMTIATNRTYPSWGYMIENGATTIWELWNGNTADPAMNSANHVMLLGDLLIWMYEDLAGISNSDNNVGFREIELSPVFTDKLDYVKASYNSISGLIRSEWSREDNSIKWDFTVPANTSARLTLKGAKALKFVCGEAEKLEYTDGGATARVNSGSYQVEVNF